MALCHSGLSTENAAAIATLAIVGARGNRAIESQGAITLCSPTPELLASGCLHRLFFSGYQLQLPM
jgi:hypothetical protein